MSDSLLVWFIVPVLLFWSVGAYNRLVRLRSQANLAFATLSAWFDQYVLLVRGNFAPTDAAHSVLKPAPREDDVSNAWASLAAAAEQFHASLKAAGNQPLNRATMGALRTAHETLCLSWLRLRNLPPDLAGPALPAALQAEWERLEMQEQMARVEFNRRVANYNEGIGQFPALWLAWIFGFKPASQL